VGVLLETRTAYPPLSIWVQPRYFDSVFLHILLSFSLFFYSFSSFCVSEMSIIDCSVGFSNVYFMISRLKSMSWHRNWVTVTEYMCYRWLHALIYSYFSIFSLLCSIVYSRSLLVLFLLVIAFPALFRLVSSYYPLVSSKRFFHWSQLVQHSSFMAYYRIVSNSNTTDDASGTETANPFGAPEFGSCCPNCSFSYGVFSIIVCALSFFFWPLYCVSFDFPLLVAHLVFSICCYNKLLAAYANIRYIYKI
jgi:hypothetical protein